MASWSFFLLAFPSAVCSVSALGVLVAGKYYEKIRISVAIATESEHNLVRGLGRSVEGVASGRGSLAGDRACPSAPSPPPGARYSVAQAIPTARGASVEDLQIRAVCWLQAAPP